MSSQVSPCQLHKEVENPRGFCFFFFFSLMFQLQCTFHQKNQQFSPLHSPSSHSRKAEEKYQREKDRFCYIGNFSPFKLNGSISPTEHISPNPFTKADLGRFVPAGATCPSGQSEQEVRRAQEWEKHLWEAGVIPLHSHHTFLSLVFLLSFFISFLWSEGSFEKPSAAFLILHRGQIASQEVTLKTLIFPTQ